MVKPIAEKIDSRLLVLDDIAIRWNGRVAFPRTRWTWRRGEQWAILGPNGSGKSLLALALCDQAPLQRGEIHYHFDGLEADAVPEQSIALLSPQTQRDLAAAESSFYQSRWHSGISEGRRTVAQFLSQASVEDRNPFEVGGYRGNPRRFRENRRRFSRWLGIGDLFRRRLAVLSNGEQRKVILVHTLLRSPRLLILDDPFGGLDRATRACLQKGHSTVDARRIARAAHHQPSRRIAARHHPSAARPQSTDHRARNPPRRFETSAGPRT